MATVTTNALINGLHGKLGTSMVLRTMRGKTFVSALGRKPDKKNESAAQRNTRVTFREATQWARNILQDPEKKKYYQQRAKALKLPNSYTAALTDYMRKPNVMKIQRRDTITYSVGKRGFAVREVKVELTETPNVPPRVVTRQQHNMWFVYHTSDKDAQPPVRLIITDNSGRSWNYYAEKVFKL